MVKVNKKYERDFTLVQNTIFKINDLLPDNEKISFKAMGIFFYLWHLPHDWEFHESEIINHANEKITAFRSGRKELEKYGFIEKKRNRNDKGQVGEYEWILNDQPELDYLKQDNPTLDYPKQGNPILDNQTLQSTKDTKDLNNKVLNDDDEALKTYSSAFGNPSNFIQLKLVNLIKKNGSDVFEHAIDLAATGNAKSPYNFIKKLLDDWSKHKLNTLEQVKSYTDSFKQSKSRKGNSCRKPKKEHLPEWATQTPEERRAETKRKQKEHDYKMQHDPEYRKHQEKSDKDLEDNLRRIRELRKENEHEE